MEGKDREPGQDYPTIILFDNQKTAINKTFTVTIDVTQENLQKPHLFLSLTTIIGKRRTANLI